MELHYCVPVWGDAYIRLFTDISLPSLLAAGNLPALSRLCRVRLRVFTRKAHVGQLRSAPIWQTLSASGIPGDIITCDDQDLSETYSGMSALHRVAIRQAGEAGAAFVPQMADGFWSDGSLATIGHLLLAGKRLVLCGGLRVTAETFTPAMRERFLCPNGTIAVPPRQLVDMAVDHLHPSMGSHFAGGPLRAINTSWWLHPYGRRSFAQTIFHAVPVALAGVGYDCKFTGTVDRGWIETLGISRAEVALVGDSDDVVLLDMAAEGRLVDDARFDPSPDAAVIGDWFHRLGEDHTLYGGRFLAKPIRFRGTDAALPEVRQKEMTTVRQTRRWAMDGLLAAEMRAVANALAETEWRGSADVILRWARAGRSPFSIAKLARYTAYLPVAAVDLDAAFHRLANHIVVGHHDHPRHDHPGATPIPANLPTLAGTRLPPGRLLGGPVHTSLGRIYLTAGPSAC